MIGLSSLISIITLNVNGQDDQAKWLNTHTHTHTHTHTKPKYMLSLQVSHFTDKDINKLEGRTEKIILQKMETQSEQEV
jgi:hypothetical protein